MTMLLAIDQNLTALVDQLERQARWLDHYSREETDVNAPIHNARRAAWAAVRNLRMARAELGRVKW